MYIIYSKDGRRTVCGCERGAFTIGCAWLPGFFMRKEGIEMGLLKDIFGSKEEKIQVVAPVAGKLVPLSEVSDPTFSEEILGQGAAVIPTENQFLSPVDGTVTTVFPTGHAVALTSVEGVEILLHIGLDTVKLNGKHFTIHAEEGQQVKKGDLLLEADLEQIKSEGYDIITPVVICNTEEFSEIGMAKGGSVTAGNVIINIIKRKG